MEIGTEDRNLDAPMGRAGGWNETVDSRQLEGRNLWRGVKVKEYSGLRLGLLHNGYNTVDLRRSCGIRWVGNGRDSLCELEWIQGLVQSMAEIWHGDLRLTINAGDKVCRRGKGIEGRFWG